MTKVKKTTADNQDTEAYRAIECAPEASSGGKELAEMTEDLVKFSIRHSDRSARGGVRGGRHTKTSKRISQTLRLSALRPSALRKSSHEVGTSGSASRLPPRKMSMAVIGGVIAVGALASMLICGRRAPSVPTAELEQVQSGAVVAVDGKSQLKALFAHGGKAVVYLTASW